MRLSAGKLLLLVVCAFGVLLIGWCTNARRSGSGRAGRNASPPAAMATTATPVVARNGQAPSAPTPLNYYVAPTGHDNWSGTLAAPNSGNTDGPFATLEGAQAAIRRRKTAGPLPTGGVTVWVRGGSYFRTTPFTLTAADAGTAAAPITYLAYAGETPIITGGKVVTGWGAPTDASIINRLPAVARANVVVANLPAQGITDYGVYEARGSTLPRAPAALEVFCQDTPLTLARWPHPGAWATVTAVPGGAKGATIRYAGNEPAKWATPAEIWLHGFWTWDWSDGYAPVAGIDATTSTITTGPPHGGTYGFSVGGRFYAQNIVEELDTPGEWYLDRAKGNLYCWPPSPLSAGAVKVSLAGVPLLSMNATSYVTVNGLTFECSRGTGVTISNGAHNSLVNCMVRNMGNYGIDLEGGTTHNLTNNVVTGSGDGGIIVNGAGLLCTNNEIAHYARWVYCYQAGIHVLGSDNEISHNKIYDAPHNAILLDGSNQTLEYNEIFQVVMQTQDAGAIYTGGNSPNMIRYNYLHDLGRGQINPARTPFAAGIYTDAGGENLTVLGNVLVNGDLGMLITGSKNTLKNNIVAGFTDDIWVDGSSGSNPSGNAISTNVLVDNAPVFMNTASREANTVANNLAQVDPLFMDPSTHNYALQSASPAFTQITGFQAIPFGPMGRK